MVIVGAYSDLYKVPVEATLLDIGAPTFPLPLSHFRPYRFPPFRHSSSPSPFPLRGAPAHLSPLPLTPFPLSALPFPISPFPLSSFRPPLPFSHVLSPFPLPFPFPALTPPFSPPHTEDTSPRRNNIDSSSDKQTLTRTFIAEGAVWQLHDRVACRRGAAQFRDLHGAFWDHFPDLYI